MNGTVLHIEDDESVGAAVSAAVRERGILSVRARTLDEGLEYLRCTERLPDVIILDLCLPDSKGLATLVAVVHEASGTPIVVFTGRYADEGDLNTIKRGASEYLVKGSVSLQDLARMIDSMSDSRAAPEFVIERTNSQVIQMVERVRDVMER